MSRINNSTIIVAIFLATLTINLVKGKLYNVPHTIKLYYFLHGPLHIYTYYNTFCSSLELLFLV